MSHVWRPNSGLVPPPPALPRAYGNIFNTSDYGGIPAGANMTFDSNGPLLNIAHVPGSTDITVGATAVYLLEWDIVGSGFGGPMTFLVNGIKVPQLSWAGDGASTGLYGVGIISLTLGDILQLRNDTGLPLFPVFQAGFVNASLTLSTI